MQPKKFGGNIYNFMATTVPADKTVMCWDIYRLIR